MAGLFQFPFDDWFDELAQYLGIGSKAKTKEAIMRAAGASPAGRALAKVAMYGAGSLVGVDVSGRVGILDVVPTRIDNVAGPTLSTTFAGAKALLKILRGQDFTSELGQISPGVANIYKAYTGKSVGARGRTTTVYDSAYDRILRAIGFRSTDEAIDSDLQEIFYSRREEKRDEKQDAIDRYIQNPTTRNAIRLKELGVRPATVKKERARKAIDRRGRLAATMTKEERREYDPLFRFT